MLYSPSHASPLKPLHFVAACRANLRALPEEVQHAFGFALYRVQCGDWPPEARPFGEGLPRSIAKLALSYRGGAYRLAFTLEFPHSVYVLHAFQKKSRSGIRTPKRELELIRARLTQARTHHRAHHHAP